MDVGNNKTGKISALHTLGGCVLTSTVYYVVTSDAFVPELIIIFPDTTLHVKYSKKIIYNHAKALFFFPS